MRDRGVERDESTRPIEERRAGHASARHPSSGCGATRLSLLQVARPGFSRSCQPLQQLQVAPDASARPDATADEPSPREAVRWRAPPRSPGTRGMEQVRSGARARPSTEPVIIATCGDRPLRVHRGRSTLASRRCRSPRVRGRRAPAPLLGFVHVELGPSDDVPATALCPDGARQLSPHARRVSRRPMTTPARIVLRRTLEDPGEHAEKLLACGAPDNLLKPGRFRGYDRGHACPPARGGTVTASTTSCTFRAVRSSGTARNTIIRSSRSISVPASLVAGGASARLRLVAMRRPRASSAPAGRTTSLPVMAAPIPAMLLLLRRGPTKD